MLLKGQISNTDLALADAGEESSMSRAYSASRGITGAAAAQQNDEVAQPSDWDPSYR